MHRLEKPERRRICYIQICTKLTIANGGKGMHIQFVSWTQDTVDQKRMPSQEVTNEGWSIEKKKATARWHMETSDRERQKLCFGSSPEIS